MTATGGGEWNSPNLYPLGSATIEGSTWFALCSFGSEIERRIHER